MNLEQLESWEVDNVDLNLRHYSGHPTDVIKEIKYNIEKYLSSQNVTDEQRRIYSAVYNALEYYSVISYIQPADFDTEDSFLSCAIDSFNQDSRYLSKKYDPSDPTAIPVISFSARIKSPISFIEKMKEKISEYIKTGRDLSNFNESLRDLLGARIVVTPPIEIKKLGPQAECEFLYKVVYDLMEKHGINKTDSFNKEPDVYEFIDINTKYHPHKQEEIQERPAKEGFAEGVNIFIPTSRIPEIDRPHVSRKVKDYVMYPKFSGYQSVHVCVIPDYSEFIGSKQLPMCIIPPAKNDYYIEYQFRTDVQNEFAEHGIASHKKNYKPDQGRYHRLAVPLYIEVDGPHDIADNWPDKPIPKKPGAYKKLKLRNFAESYERFYGHTFADRFGISFKEFRDLFSTSERDDILSLRKVPVFNPELDSYELASPEITVALTDNQIFAIKQKLSSHEEKTMMRVLDELGITDGSKSQDSTTVEFLSRKPKVKLVRVRSGKLSKESSKTQETPTKPDDNIQSLEDN